ncbi:MAG: transposase [Candidatus Staskawiczbacteria bacterium]|nr:transposase [Candidatus Staskawiczbacteria bacterium]
MPRREQDLSNGEIYHVVIRALDDNLIFKDVNDYYRGIFSIYEFNNANSVTIQARRKARTAFKNSLASADRPRGSISAELVEIDKRDKLVEVSAFCFMPNHIHLLLRQSKDGGISKFMQKLGGGYARYFNDRYQRKGHVFMDAFKSVHIKDNNQFMVVVPYIFTNPTALIEQGWKEKGIRKHSVKEVIKFLEGYKWSSYQDCIGIKNFASVTERDFLLETMGSERDLRVAVKNWIEYKNNVSKDSDGDLLLE